MHEVHRVAFICARREEGQITMSNYVRNIVTDRPWAHPCLIARLSSAYACNASYHVSFLDPSAVGCEDANLKQLRGMVITNSDLVREVPQLD